MENLKMSEPLHVSDAEFEEVVLKSSTPVIVDFWAPWCGPCRMVAPILDKIAKDMGDKVKIAKVNTDENVEWASKYGVRGIPTMLFVKDGEVKHTQVGAVPEAMIRSMLDEHLAVATAAG